VRDIEKSPIFPAVAKWSLPQEPDAKTSNQVLVPSATEWHCPASGNPYTLAAMRAHLRQPWGGGLRHRCAEAAVGGRRPDERTVEIQTIDAVRLCGGNAIWKGVTQRLLDDTCQQHTGRNEEDGCWPGFEMP
jgi:hypothetical protein